MRYKYNVYFLYFLTQNIYLVVNCKHVTHVVVLVDLEQCDWSSRKEVTLKNMTSDEQHDPDTVYGEWGRKREGEGGRKWGLPSFELISFWLLIYINLKCFL